MNALDINILVTAAHAIALEIKHSHLICRSPRGVSIFHNVLKALQFVRFDLRFFLFPFCDRKLRRHLQQTDLADMARWRPRVAPAVRGLQPTHGP